VLQYLLKDKDDFQARLARARLFPLINEPWKAKQQYAWLLDKHPGEPEVQSCAALVLYTGDHSWLYSWTWLLSCTSHGVQ